MKYRVEVEEVRRYNCVYEVEGETPRKAWEAALRGDTLSEQTVGGPLEVVHRHIRWTEREEIND